MNTQSTAQRTPGPWKAHGMSVYAEPEKLSFGGPVRNYLRPISVEPQYNESADDAGYIENWPHHIRIPGETEAYANARLIASAPELLAALEEVTDLAYRLAMESPKLNPSVDRIIPSARAAITAAKGV